MALCWAVLIMGAEKVESQGVDVTFAPNSAKGAKILSYQLKALMTRNIYGVDSGDIRNLALEAPSP